MPQSLVTQSQPVTDIPALFQAWRKDGSLAGAGQAAPPSLPPAGILPAPVNVHTAAKWC